VISAVVFAVLLGPAPTAPVRVEELTRETPDGPVRAWVARVDLADPRVSFCVTGPRDRRRGDPEGTEARLVPTDVWAEREGVDLAVNAGFFGRLDAAGGPGRGWTDGQPVDIVGLSRSDGRTVSPSGVGGGEPEPVELCGITGERVFAEADPVNGQEYARLSYCWEKNGIGYALTGTLTDTMNEEEMKKMACSIGSE